MAGTFYVTTPIYYVNDAPHLGHAYTTIAADALARWYRMRGRDVMFLTGTDEHGQKVLEAARKRGISPIAHADAMVGPYQALWKRLDVTNDDFIRTTEERHVRVVQAILQRLKDQGEVYEADYEGWYSTAAERYWTEKELVDGKCPDTGQPVQWLKEKNWFFRMARHADRLRAWIDAHPDFLRPESRRNEVLGYLRQEVGDLCISRPKSRMEWGIPLPFAPDFVTYVWFDALINYISGIGYGSDDARFQRSWPADVHLVGKDILTTHAVYWSTMLFAIGIEPAHCLFAHGWWTVEGRKMSKSLGNVVDPNLLLDCYGPDAVRYFLLREIPFGGDGDFSHAAFMVRYNADLANDLGNLAHRALSMIGKWLGGTIPELDAPAERDRALEELAGRAYRSFSEEFEAFRFSRALEALWELVREGNVYIDREEPWRLNREGNRARLGGVLRRSIEVARVAGALLAPICPRKSAELAAKLGLPGPSLDGADRLDGLVAGTSVEAGPPLFPRMEELPAPIREALLVASLDAASAPAPAPPPPAATLPPPAPAAPTSDVIGIEDFQKVQLRTGRVVGAERHPKADRLLVLEVDIGEPQPRTIVAGIAARFAPADLVGKDVVVVANLKPAKLRGIESRGMLLAVGGETVQALVGPSELVPPGSVVR